MANFEARKVLMKDAQGRYVIPFTGAVETVNGQKPDENGNVVIEGVDTTTLLTKAVAAETYLSKTDAASTYLRVDTAADTFLSKADASSTYLTPAQANAAYLGVGDKAVSAETADNAVSATMASKAISDVNGNAIATTYATKAELEEAIKPPLAQTVWSSTQRDSVLPAGTALAVPSYVAGASQIAVCVDGLMLAKGRDYEEASSTTITFAFDLEADSVVTVVTTVSSQEAGASVVLDDSRSSVIAAGAAYSVPPHTVGLLRCWLDGVACVPGLHFTNETETSIAFTSDIPADMQIIIRIEG